MNSRIGRLAAASFLCLLSCAPQSPPGNSAFAPALAPLSSWRTKVEVRQSVSQTIGGRDIESRQSFSTTYRFKVLGRDADGGLSIEAVYENLALKLTSRLGSASFDSSEPDDPSSPLAALGGLVGGSFTFALGPTMRLGGIGGLPELAARMAAAAKDPAFASSASAYMNEGSIRHSLEAIFGLFPAAKVAAGESWIVESAMDCSMPLVSRNKITATKAAGYRISARIEGVIGPAGGGGAVELRGTVSGGVELDAASLRILGGCMNQNLSGSVLVRGTRIPMEVKNSMRFE